MTKQQLDFVRLVENSLQTPRKLPNGEILVWLYFHQLEQFTNLIGGDYFCEGGIDVNLQDDCVVVDVKDLLEYLDIDEDCIEIDED